MIPVPQDQEARKTGDRIQYMLDAALSARRSYYEDDHVERMRAFSRLYRRRLPTSEDDELNLVTSLTATGLDNLKSTLLQTFFSPTPIFTAEPLSANSREAAKIYERALELMIRRTRSHNALKQAIIDAVEVPAGVVRARVVAINVKPYVEARYVPFEDFAVYPAGVQDFSVVSTFERVRLPLGYFRRLVSAGLMSREAYDVLARSYGSTVPHAEDGLGAYDPDVYDAPERPVEVWECFIRADNDEYTLERWLYHESSATPLARLPLQLPPGYDRPPYTLLRAYPIPGTLYGVPPTAMIMDYQHMADLAISAMLREAERNLVPPRVVRDRNLYEQITQHGFLSGAVFFAPSSPYGQNAIEVYYPQPSPFLIQLLQTATTLASQAIPSPPNLPPGSRKTASEVAAYASVSSARVWHVLSNIKEGLEEFINEVYWPLYAESAGLVEIVMGDEQSPDSLVALGKGEARIPVVSQGEMREVYIPSVYRNDVWFRTTGGNAPDEQARQRQNLAELTMMLMRFLPVVRQDAGAWKLMRKLLEAYGVYDWQDVLGEPPSGMNEQAAMLAAQLSRRGVKVG